MNNFGTNENVNFLRHIFVREVNFLKNSSPSGFWKGKILLDRRKVLWYDYSIIIGKKSAHLWAGLYVCLF